MVHRRRASISTVAGLVVGVILVAGAGLLTGCGRSEDQAADERLARAIEEVGYFGFQRAGELFESVVADSEPGSERWQQAMYGQAVCLQQRSPISPERIDQAEALFRQLIGTAPVGKYAARATLNLGRIAELSDYYGDVLEPERARAYYQQVIDGWPSDPIAGEATLRLAATYVQTYDNPQVLRGIRILESWLAAHPGEPLAVMMQQYIGDTYFSPLEDLPSAMRWYRRADVPGVLDRSRLAAMYWRMARMADEKLADRDTAVAYYTKLVEIAPTGHRAWPAKLALERLGAPVPDVEILRDDDDHAARLDPDRSNRAAPGGGDDTLLADGSEVQRK